MAWLWLATLLSDLLAPEPVPPARRLAAIELRRRRIHRRDDRR